MRSPRVYVSGEKSELGQSESAVSEIVGVVMLLAMLITVMSGVVFLIEPYLSDFEDQRDWAATFILSEQISDRIEVAGSAPEGTGSRTSLEMNGIRMLMVENIEEWTLQADLTDFERVEIEVSNSQVHMSCQNAACATLRLTQDDGSQTEWSVLRSDVEQTFNLSSSLSDVAIFDVFDQQGTALHRLAILSLSGLELDSEMNKGKLQIAMVNGAVIERRPGIPWTINEFPTILFDELPDGTPRLSMMMTDLVASDSLPHAANPIMELTSRGATNLFDGEVWNFRFSMSNTMHDIIDPQYVHHWTKGHEIHVATDSLEDYNGIAPYGRQSGVDGLTVLPSTDLILEIGLQQVVVS